MAESEQDRIFRTKVIPIMNKVRNELQDKMADELKEHTSSFAGLMKWSRKNFNASTSSLILLWRKR